MSDSTKSKSDLPPAPPDETVVVEEKRIRRLNWSLVSDATMGAFNAERGFLFTIREFLIRPRTAFEGFVGKDRMRYSNPIKMVIFLSAITAFLMHQLQTFELIQDSTLSGDQSAEAEELAAFTKRNYNLLLLSCLPIMALVTRLVYFGRPYNFLEHLALNSFQVSVITIAFILMLPAITLWPITNLVYMVLSLLYQTWLYRRVLGPGWFRAIVATLFVTAAYMSAMMALSQWWFSVF